MKKYYLEVLGCPMRAIEAQRLSDYFDANGLHKSERKEDADLIAIFTCSVVDDTENRTIEHIEALKDLNCEVLLMGCSPAMSPEKFKSFFSGKMISTKDLESEIDDYFKDFKVKFENIPLPAKYQDDYPYGQYYYNQYSTLGSGKKGVGKKTTKPALIITSKGCNNYCSYCTMKLALGPLKSYPLKMITDNYMELRKNKYTKFIFNGDDTGSYGQDINLDFGDVLNACQQIDDNYSKKKLFAPKTKWVVDNLHPQWFNKLFDCFSKYAQNGKITEMVIPLQSASNSILKLMRRHYEIETTVNNLKKLMEGTPALKIQTHFIIGFPTETEEDIRNIAGIIQMNLFHSIILLRYYETENSSSIRINPKIDADTVNKRIDMLKQVLEKNNTKYLIDGIIP